MLLCVSLLLATCLCADIRYLQTFTIHHTSQNMLRTECYLAKSDLFVSCQLVILNINNNKEVLSPVNIIQSNFSMLLPSSEGDFLVTARAVDRYGAAVDLEIFNISYNISIITPKSTIASPSYPDGEQ